MDNTDSKGRPEKGANDGKIVRIDKLERKISRRRDEIKELKVELAKLRQNSKLPWPMVISLIVILLGGFWIYRSNEVNHKQLQGYHQKEREALEYLMRRQNYIYGGQTNQPFNIGEPGPNNRLPSVINNTPWPTHTTQGTNQPPSTNVIKKRK